jgi:hypothetical protein
VSIYCSKARGLVFRPILLLFVLGLQSLNAHGDDRDTLRARFVKRYPDHMFIYPLIKQRSSSFTVQRRNIDQQSLTFRPNHSVSMGIGLYVFDVGVELALDVPLDEGSTSQFGTSNVRDLSGLIVGNNWGLDFFTQRYQGFYVAGLTPVSGNDNGVAVRSDIALRSTGVNGFYVFNKRSFSLRSAYNFAERQYKSGGSWALAGTLNSSSFESDTVVLTSRLRSQVGLQKTYGDLQFTTFSVAPGYTYNLIYHNWFLNFSLAIGPAHHWIFYVDETGRDRYDIIINSFIDNRIALGYNSDRWFGGISFVNLVRQVKFSEFQVATSATSFKLLIGYRIPARGIFKKRAWDFLPLPKALRKH